MTNRLALNLRAGVNGKDEKTSDFLRLHPTEDGDGRRKMYEQGPLGLTKSRLPHRRVKQDP